MMKLNINRVAAAKILTGVACVGVAVTGYLAVRKGSKIMATVDEVKTEMAEDENKNKSKLEVSARYISRVAPVIAPVVVAGIVTEGCIIGAQVLSLKEIAALTGTVSYLIANRKALEEAICELPGGKEALDKVKEKTAELTAEKAIEKDAKKTPWTRQTVEETGLGDDLCLDSWSGRIFRCDHNVVRNAFNDANDERDNGMDLPFTDGDVNLPVAMSYNDVYFTRINLEPSMLCHINGYPANDDYYPHRRIPFEIKHVKLKDMDELHKKKYGEDLYIVTFPEEYAPMEMWQEV